MQSLVVVYHALDGPTVCVKSDAELAHASVHAVVCVVSASAYAVGQVYLIVDEVLGHLVVHVVVYAIVTRVVLDVHLFHVSVHAHGSPCVRTVTHRLYHSQKSFLFQEIDCLSIFSNLLLLIILV